MPVSPDDRRPTYVQIADDLRRKVATGELSPGQRLPSGRQLATEYGVAPMTIQQALNELGDVVVRWQGRGVFVREDADRDSGKDPVDQVIAELASLRESVEALEKRVGALENQRRRRQ